MRDFFRAKQRLLWLDTAAHSTLPGLGQCCLAWDGAAWPGTVLPSLGQCCLAWSSAAWPGTVLPGLGQCYLAWSSATWPGTVYLAWSSATWPGTVLPSLGQCYLAWSSATWPGADSGQVVGEDWQVFLHTHLADNRVDFIILKEKAQTFQSNRKLICLWHFTLISYCYPEKHFPLNLEKLKLWHNLPFF